MPCYIDMSTNLLSSSICISISMSQMSRQTTFKIPFAGIMWPGDVGKHPISGIVPKSNCLLSTSGPYSFRCLPNDVLHGHLARYEKLRVAHAPDLPGMFSPSATLNETTRYRSRYASRHVRDARSVMHVGIDNPRCRGKRSRHSRRMRNPYFYVSGKRLIGQ